MKLLQRALGPVLVRVGLLTLSPGGAFTLQAVLAVSCLVVLQINCVCCCLRYAGESKVAMEGSMMAAVSSLLYGVAATCIGSCLGYC
jgi:hypothetical protein